MRWSDYRFSSFIPNVHVHTFISIHIHPLILNNIHTCTRLKYRSPKSLQHPTLTKKYGRWRACSLWCLFPRRVRESLQDSVARLTSVLEQAFRNASGEGSSNRSVTFAQTPTTTQPEERMGEHGQEPQHNPTLT